MLKVAAFAAAALLACSSCLAADAANGLQMNGLRMNGKLLNSAKLNGLQTHGRAFHRTATTGDRTAAAASLTVRRVRLP